MTNADERLALLNMAHASVDSGDFKRAEACARRALSLSPDEPMALSILALILSNDPNQFEEALQLCAVAMAIDPEEVQVRHLYTTIALKAGRFEAARQQAEAIRSHWPGDRRCLYELALAANALGDLDTVRALIDYRRDIKVIRAADILGEVSCSFHLDMVRALRSSLAAGGTFQPGTMSGGQRLRDAFSTAQPEADRLRWFLNKCVEASQPEHHRPRKVSLAWANFMGSDDFEQSHIHDTAQLSGVYYPLVSERELDSVEGSLLFGPHHLGPGVPALPTHRFSPRTGDVVIFPSHLPHTTLPFSGSGERISVAFDVS